MEAHENTDRFVSGILGVLIMFLVCTSFPVLRTALLTLRSIANSVSFKIIAFQPLIVKHLQQSAQYLLFPIMSIDRTTYFRVFKLRVSSLLYRNNIHKAYSFFIQSNVNKFIVKVLVVLLVILTKMVSLFTSPVFQCLYTYSYIL